MTARSALWAVAVDQYGFVTTSDADDLDLSQAAVDMLVRRRQLARAARGVYRFPDLPATEYDPYMLAVLWTGSPQACLSHDTALAAYDVCDINPDRIHVCVPTGRRLRRRGGELYVVHHADLAEEQLGWWHRIRAVTLPTAVAQCIATGVPTYLLRQALATGRARGLFSAGTADSLTAELEQRDAL